MTNDSNDYSLKDHWQTAAEAERILKEKYGKGRFDVSTSVRFKTYSLCLGAYNFGSVVEYGASAEEVARKAAELAEKDHVKNFRRLDPRDSFGNELGGPNEQT